MPLTIAAKVDEVDRTYHDTRIKPLLEDPRVDFVGEIGDSEKGAFLGDAAALFARCSKSKPILEFEAGFGHTDEPVTSRILPFVPQKRAASGPRCRPRALPPARGHRL